MTLFAAEDASSLNIDAITTTQVGRGKASAERNKAVRTARPPPRFAQDRPAPRLLCMAFPSTRI